MSGAGRGRGRGLGPVPKPHEPAAAPGPQVATAAAASTCPGDVGRRAAASGRRGETRWTTPPEDDKKEQRGTPPEVPTGDMAGLDLTSLAPRPGFGQLGRRYRMFANHFELTFNNKVLTVYRYHIEIVHKVKLTRDDNRPIFWKCLMEKHVELGITPNEYTKIAFDGVNTCFALNQLKVPADKNNDSLKFEIETTLIRHDRPIRVQVTFRTVGPFVVDVSQAATTNLTERNLVPIQIIDILLRQYRSYPYSENTKVYYPFKSSIFMIPGSGNTPGGLDLGSGREIWKGLFTSAHVVEQNKILVNMDVDHSAFYKFSNTQNNNNNGKYSVIQFLCDVLNEAERRQVYKPADLRSDTALDEPLKKIFEKEIKGLKVVIDYKQANARNENKEFKVMAIDRSAVDCKFTNREGVETNVAEYYSQTYGPLKYPRMFTLKVGSKQRPINLPIEHCFLARNQKVIKKLSANQVATMIRQTCMAPADRKQSIEQMVNLARFPEDTFLKSFGIQINPRMLCVNGRKLPDPSLMFGGNQVTTPHDGVWKAQGYRFLNPARINRIAALAFGRAPNSAFDFVSSLMNVCRQCGMSVPDAKDIFFHLENNTSPQRVEIAFEKIHEAMPDCQLVVVFIQVKGSSVYSDVKRVAEIQKGIMTQCVVYKTVERSSQDTLLNIALKVNMKMGGVNCALHVREQAAKYLLNPDSPTLVLGIDVTHPGPHEKKKPSVASIVGSMDTSHMRYGASIIVQQKSQEALVYLSDRVTDRLMAFYKATQRKPERILVYRDGVSEGQFVQVLREELRGIRESCLKLDANYRPKITFVVVQKRHHTRLFPENPSEGCGKARNVLPGCVVDTTILHPDEFAFYLCSHAGIQGTSRPTRYYVLHDDNGFSADDMQCISYYLCHCFSRCTRAVSIPAPVYYADLACTRARSHLASAYGDLLSDTVSTRSGSDGSSSTPKEDELIAATSVIDNIRTEMYFT